MNESYDERSNVVTEDLSSELRALADKDAEDLPTEVCLPTKVSPEARRFLLEALETVERRLQQLAADNPEPREDEPLEMTAARIGRVVVWIEDGRGDVRNALIDPYTLTVGELMEAAGIEPAE